MKVTVTEPQSFTSSNFYRKDGNVFIFSIVGFDEDRKRYLYNMVSLNGTTFFVVKLSEEELEAAIKRVGFEPLPDGTKILIEL